MITLSLLLMATLNKRRMKETTDLGKRDKLQFPIPVFLGGKGETCGSDVSQKGFASGSLPYKHTNRALNAPSQSSFWH